MTIPASAIVSVQPGVIAAGGAAPLLSGLILTGNTRAPIGLTLSFATAAAVAAFFGAVSQEASMAAVYFAGYDSMPSRPSALLFRQYNGATAVAGYLRGGPVANTLTPAQLQALSGTLTLSVDGTPQTSAPINFGTANSFSAAAALIQAALTGVTAAFDSLSGAFVITSATTGATSAVSAASGPLAAPLLLTTAVGAVASPGAAPTTPAAFLVNVIAQSPSFASFTTTTEPSVTDKVAFAAWANAQLSAIAYVLWTTEIALTTTDTTGTSVAAIKANGYAGTIAIYEPSDLNHAAFVMGCIAAVDFTRSNGRITLAFRTQSGLTAGVADAQAAANLEANGANFYGSYAGGAFFYAGAITGPFLWIDSFIDQIQLRAGIQAACFALLQQAGQVPYNPAGYATIEAACLDPIQAALRFGSIRPGVTLSNAQRQAINAQAGLIIDDVVQTRGWYLAIGDASPAVRAARQSPPISFFYADGQSVQRINIASLEVQ